MKTLSVLLLVALLSASAYADRSATRSLAALPERISSLTVPVSVSVSTIQDALNRVAPKVVLSGSECCHEWGVWGQGGEVKYRYRAERRTIGLGTNKNKLTGSARIDASALVYNRFVGILGKTGWGRVARVEIDARAALSSTVQINKRWRLQVRGVDANVDIYDTDINILGILEIDIDPWVGGYKRRIERQAENDTESALRDVVRNNDFVKRGATQAWNRACRSIRLPTDPVLWVEIRPFAVRAAQPVIGRQVVTVQVGVDAYTRIVSRRTTPKCGRLPSEINLESPRRGQLNLIMPVMLDYDYLDELLKNVVDKQLQQDYLDFREFRTEPHGSSLLVEADVTVDTSSKATVCLLAKPQIDAVSRTLVLRNVVVHTESGNKCVSIGRAAEALEGIALNIGPQIDAFRQKANKALRGLSNQHLKIEGSLTEVRLTRVDVGPEQLRLVVEGSARGVSIRIP